MHDASLAQIAVTTAGSVAETPPAEWSRLAAGRTFYVSYDWLRALEADRAFDPLYLLARDETGRLVGALPTYLWDGKGGWVVGAYDPAASPLTEMAPFDVVREEWFPLLLAGTRAGYANEPLLHPDLSPATRQEVCAQLVAAAFALADEVGARTVGFLYLTPRGARELTGPLADAASIFLYAAGTRLEVEWSSFDGYLAALTADRRRKFLRDIRSFEQSGATLEVGRLGRSHDRLVPLVTNVQRRHGQAADTPEALGEYLSVQARELDARSVLFTSRLAERIVACVLAYESEQVLYMRLAGLDYERLSEGATYFNVGFYAPIRFAAEHDLRAIDFGLGSYTPKLLRGARPYPLYWALAPPERYREELGRFAPGWNEGAFEWWDGELRKFVGGLDPEQWLPS